MMLATVVTEELSMQSKQRILLYNSSDNNSTWMLSKCITLHGVIYLVSSLGNGKVIHNL